MLGCCRPPALRRGRWDHRRHQNQPSRTSFPGSPAWVPVGRGQVPGLRSSCKGGQTPSPRLGDTGLMGGTFSELREGTCGETIDCSAKFLDAPLPGVLGSAQVSLPGSGGSWVSECWTWNGTCFRSGRSSGPTGSPPSPTGGTTLSRLTSPPSVCPLSGWCLQPWRDSSTGPTRPHSRCRGQGMHSGS